MTHRKPFIVIAIALIALLPLVALAAPGDRQDRRGDRGPGRHLLPPPGYLDLTEEQMEAVRGILEGVRGQLDGTRETGQALREEMQAALEGENPDATTVGELAIELFNLRQEVRGVLQDAEGQFSAILDAEQLSKWENFQELRRFFRGPGRHRGAGGDGGFEVGQDFSNPIG